MRHLLIAAALLSLTSAAAFAACTDSSGRLTKCSKPAGGKIKCKDAKGHHAKCGLPGTHPVDK